MTVKYKIAMFDMDGTFVDSKRFHTKVFYHFFCEYVKPVTMEEVETGMGNTVREIFTSFFIPENEFQNLFSKLDFFCRYEIDDLLEEATVAKDICETLKRLREYGLLTAVVTNSMQVVTEQILKRYELFEQFDFISGADMESVNKNGRCEKVRMKSRAKKKEVLYIGDSEHDILLANNMGYDGCFTKTKIAWYKDENYIKDVLMPTFTVNRLIDIPKMICV